MLVTVQAGVAQYLKYFTNQVGESSAVVVEVQSHRDRWAILRDLNASPECVTWARRVEAQHRGFNRYSNSPHGDTVCIHSLTVSPAHTHTHTYWQTPRVVVIIDSPSLHLESGSIQAGGNGGGVSLIWLPNAQRPPHSRSLDGPRTLHLPGSEQLSGTRAH